MRFDTGCPCCRDDFYDYDEWLMQRVTVIEHPVAQDALARARYADPAPEDARRLWRALGCVLCAEAARDLPLKAVETGAGMFAPALADACPTLAFLPEANADFIEGVRGPLPMTSPDVAERMAILFDSAPNNGEAAVVEITRLKERGAKSVRYVCALAAPEGVEAVRCAHPDVDIFVVAMDGELTDEKA